MQVSALFQRPTIRLAVPRQLLGPKTWRRRYDTVIPRKQEARSRFPVRVQASKGWPDPDFIADTLAQFPGKGIADVEEARVLFSSGGYTILDVRSEVEVEETGKIRGSVSIPIVNARKVYSPEAGRKVVEAEPVDPAEWLAQVAKRFPNKQAKLLVLGSGGARSLTLEALQALDDAGYPNLVKLKGGYDAWSQVFDFKLGRKKVLGHQPITTGVPVPDVPAAVDSWREERRNGSNGAHSVNGGGYSPAAEQNGWNGAELAHAPAEANGINGSSAPGAPGLEGNPLFNSQFMNVLQTSLARQGADALLANTRPEEPRVSATEEVLTTAVSQSKKTLALMHQWKDQLDRQIAMQQKQCERLEFALNKCKGDAAYLNALKEMLHES